MPDTANPYDQGQADAKAAIASTLRMHAMRSPGDEGYITDATVREIFAGAFGVKACDDEFGPPPSGAGVRDALDI